MKAIFFDFDGVLADTFQLNYELEVQKNGLMTLDEFRKRSETNNYDYINDKYYSIENDSYFINQRQKFTKNYFFPVKDILLKLRRHYRLFIVTGGTKKNTNIFLSYIDVENIFEDILGKDLEQTKSERIRNILSQYNVKAENSVFVTDTLGDLRDVADLDIKKLVVTWGYHNINTLKKGRFDISVDDISDLDHCIKELLPIED